MIRFVIKIALVAIIALVAYNYFYGEGEEKEQADEIVEKVSDLGKSVGAFIKTEKEKFDAGNYDQELGKMKNVLSDLGEKLKNGSKNLKEKLKDLEYRRMQLQETIDQAEDGAEQLTGKSKEELKEDLQKLYEETRALSEEIQKD